MALARIVRVIGVTCSVLAAVVLAAWLAGRVLSDRWGWSQWLLWVPTPAAFAAAGLGLAAACRRGPTERRRRRRLALWGAAAAAVVVYFVGLEHRFLRFGGDDRPALRLLHSSLFPATREARRLYVDKLIEADADVTVLSGPLNRRDREQYREAETKPAEISTVWPFMVISKHAILEAAPIAFEDDIYIAGFRVDTTATLGRPITIYAVDLPSEPGLARGGIADRVRAMLDDANAPPPDIVVGDFNMTRGSASLEAIFPDLSHAWDQAGRGYGATFHRNFPMYHLDHTLLAETVRAGSYDLVNLGVGRHLVQVVGLVPVE